MLKLKVAGRDLELASVSLLASYLAENCKGMHVSIIYKSKPSGMLKSVFLSISESGLICESYGEQRAFDVSTIEAALYQSPS